MPSRPLTVLTVLCAVALAAPSASADTTGTAPLLPSDAALVSGGPGSQTDPHLDGSRLVYTSLDGTGSRISYVDLSTGSAADIATAGHRDSLPDVSGNLVVFRRVFLDATASRPIMVFDMAAADLGASELAPEEGSRRASPSIGATTVAFMQFVEGSSTKTEVCVADAADRPAPATCLTADGDMSNRDPAVSPDGSTVAFAKCLTDGTGCDVYVARRGSDGTWGSPRQLTDSTGEDILPDTDGSIVTYASNAAGDFDVWWEAADGTSEHQLVLPDSPGSIETNPHLSGGAISFEREVPGSTEADLYLYRPAASELTRLTETAVDETLNALSLDSTGLLRVAWAQPDGTTPGHNDIHALQGQLGAGPAYQTCLLYDPAKSHRLGSTAPLRLQLCDDAGHNLSAPEVELAATGLVKRDATASTATAESSGNANPDSAFRYDADLAGYVFNLSTKGLSRGTWELRFTVAGEPGTVHRLPFDVR